ncbi:MAG: hypothetical protein JW995_15495 [Melioribacteraceae bacterium]|nr:hypothetical protein [Melioribacteraceae bacterium]
MHALIKDFKLNLILLLKIHILFYGIYYCSPTDSLIQFRGFPFGSSVNTVELNEKAGYLQTFKGFGLLALSYTGDIFGEQARIDYIFRDSILTEGSYNIDCSGRTRELFIKLTHELSSLYGNADFYANNLISSDTLWIKANEFGLYDGPELYWNFDNGFICLLASRFNKEETITILYVVNKEINEYSSEAISLPETNLYYH